MSKNTNLSFLTDYITADITNGRIGINTPSPTVAFDVTGAGKFSSSVQIGSTLNQTLSVGLVAPTTDTLNQIFAGQAAFGGQAAGGETDIGNNWYYYSGWKYRITAPSSNIKLNGDVISFERAASGTANAAITFSESMRISSAGNVLVGTTIDYSKFCVFGNIVAVGASGVNGLLSRDTGNNTIYGFINSGNGNFTVTNSGIANVGYFNMSTGAYVPTSDINKKKDFEDSAIGLKEILQLKPTLYRMKTDNSEGDKELGFIAQDVKGIIPSAYQESEDFIGLNFNPILAAAIKAIQELSAEITILKNK